MSLISEDSKSADCVANLLIGDDTFPAAPSALCVFCDLSLSVSCRNGAGKSDICLAAVISTQGFPLNPNTVLRVMVRVLRMTASLPNSRFTLASVSAIVRP